MNRNEKLRRGLKDLNETFVAEGRYKSMVAFVAQLNEMFPPNVEGIIVNQDLDKRVNDGVRAMLDFIAADYKFRDDTTTSGH